MSSPAEIAAATRPRMPTPSASANDRCMHSPLTVCSIGSLLRAGPHRDQPPTLSFAFESLCLTAAMRRSARSAATTNLAVYPAGRLASAAAGWRVHSLPAGVQRRITTSSRSSSRSVADTSVVPYLCNVGRGLCGQYRPHSPQPPTPTALRDEALLASGLAGGLYHGASAPWCYIAPPLVMLHPSHLFSPSYARSHTSAWMLQHRGLTLAMGRCTSDTVCRAARPPLGLRSASACGPSLLLEYPRISVRFPASHISPYLLLVHDVSVPFHSRPHSFIALCVCPHSARLRASPLWAALASASALASAYLGIRTLGSGPFPRTIYT